MVKEYKEYWVKFKGFNVWAKLGRCGVVMTDGLVYSEPNGDVVGEYVANNKKGMDFSNRTPAKLFIHEEFYGVFALDVPLDRWPVKSSNIVAVGHDASLDILDVEFKGGDVYRYFGVDSAEFNEFINAKSLGKYLQQNIEGIYSYTKKP